MWCQACLARIACEHAELVWLIADVEETRERPRSRAAGGADDKAAFLMLTNYTDDDVSAAFYEEQGMVRSYRQF